MDTTPALTGLDLKLRRVRKQIKVKDLAREIGVSSSRLSRIESPNNRVTDSMFRRYTEALDTFGTSSTSQDGRSAA